MLTSDCLLLIGESAKIGESAVLNKTSESAVRRNSPILASTALSPIKCRAYKDRIGESAVPGLCLPRAAKAPGLPIGEYIGIGTSAVLTNGESVVLDRLAKIGKSGVLTTNIGESAAKALCQDRRSAVLSKIGESAVLAKIGETAMLTNILAYQDRAYQDRRKHRAYQDWPKRRAWRKR